MCIYDFSSNFYYSVETAAVVRGVGGSGGFKYSFFLTRGWNEHITNRAECKKPTIEGPLHL